MVNSRIVLSVDGGGTKTDVCIARVSDSAPPQVLGRAQGGPANVTSLGTARVMEVLERTIATAAADAQIASSQFDHAIVALAGGSDRESCRAMEQQLTERYCKTVRVMSDAECILRVAESLSPQGYGAIGLLVGTGSVAFFRASSSQAIERAGGWGPILGDDGSGYWIGREAVRRVLRAADEGKPTSIFAKAIFAALATNTPRELIGKINAAPAKTPVVAGLARTVFDLANANDPLALEILQESAVAIGSLVTQAIHRMDGTAEKTVVACAGSVITRASHLTHRVGERLRATGLSKIHFVDDPAIAAIPLAMK